MRMFVLVIMLVILTVVLTVLGGCAAFTDYAEAPVPNVVRRDQLATSPLKTEVSASQTIVAWGDTLIITARLVNRLDVPVSVRYASGCTGGYSLWSGDRIVYRPERICTMAPVTRTYPPGASEPYTIKWVWNQESVRPGAYRFLVGLGATGEMDSGEIPIVLKAR